MSSALLYSFRPTRIIVLKVVWMQLHFIIHICLRDWLEVTFSTYTSFRGRLGVPYIHLFVYICWSYRMITLMLCYHSIAPSICKDDSSASAICYLYRFNLVNWCKGMPTYVSFYCFGGLSSNYLFYFAASWYSH